MSDLYTEVLVKKQQTGKDKAIKGVLIFFTVLFAAAGIMMNPLILLLALVLGIVDYIFIPKLSVEFEYLYVNGELDIDRIYSQSRRKRAASYELSNMEILAPYQSHQLDSYKKTRVSNVTTIPPESKDRATNRTHSSSPRTMPCRW